MEGYQAGPLLYRGRTASQTAGEVGDLLLRCGGAFLEGGGSPAVLGNLGASGLQLGLGAVEQGVYGGWDPSLRHARLIELADGITHRRCLTFPPLAQPDPIPEPFGLLSR